MIPYGIWCAANVVEPEPSGPPHSPYIWLDGADDAAFGLTGSNINSWTNKGSALGSFIPAGDTTQPIRNADSVNFPNGSTSGADDAVVLVGDNVNITSKEDWTFFVVTSSVSTTKTASQVLMSRYAEVGVGEEAIWQKCELRLNPGNPPLSIFYDTRDAISHVANTANILTGGHFTRKLLTQFVTTPTTGLIAAFAEAYDIITTPSKSTTFPNAANGYGTDMFIGAYQETPYERATYGSKRFGGVLTGNIHEWLAYDRVLNSTELSEVRTYLNSKWVIYDY